ncbi:hypothetical protein, partial [Pandoraea sputorum]|uniref:hypothetical protein n=1 Tax=Pandoraea sputorum TaxID=93222 RepID=UPI003555D6D4
FFIYGKSQQSLIDRLWLMSTLVTPRATARLFIQNPAMDAPERGGMLIAMQISKQKLLLRAIDNPGL